MRASLRTLFILAEGLIPRPLGRKRVLKPIAIPQKKERPPTALRRGSFILSCAVFLAAISFASCGKDARLSKTSLAVQEEFGAESADDLCRYGVNYFYGWHDFPVDYEKALDLFKDAAAMQSGEACSWIAEFYQGGYVYKQNYKKAAEWHERAAALGRTESFFMLGVLYECGGHGLKADPKKSQEWYERAAALETD